MLLSAEQDAMSAAGGGAGVLPPKRKTIPVESRTLSCHPRACPLLEKGSLKCVSRKSASIKRRAMWRLILMSKPVPKKVAKPVSEPRNVQFGVPVHPEIFTELAGAPPNNASMNGVNLSYLR